MTVVFSAIFLIKRVFHFFVGLTALNCFTCFIAWQKMKAYEYSRLSFFLAAKVVSSLAARSEENGCCFYNVNLQSVIAHYITVSLFVCGT